MTKATVLITTKNRCDDLRNAIKSALCQSARPEVLVVDDGSTDNTANMVRQEFPDVKLHVSENSKGYIFQRNFGARIASGEIIFSMDDDAVFSGPLIVEQTLKDFDNPIIGAVAIPYIDINKSPRINDLSPSNELIYAAYSYIGTSHAIRRDIFQSLGGYRELLIHQSEEEDLCIRMLNSGHIVRCGRSDPIHHFESPRRSFSRMDFYGARNKVLYAWNNVPFPYFPFHLALTTFLTSIQNHQPNRAFTRWRGVWDAYSLCLSNKADRRPVSSSVYRLSRKLKKKGPLPIHDPALTNLLKSNGL